MESKARDSNLTNVEVKPEPTEFLTLVPKEENNSHFHTDYKNDNNIVMIKEEEHVDVSVLTQTKFDASKSMEMASSDLKIKLDVGDETSNFPCTKNEPCEQETVNIETSTKNAILRHKCRPFKTRKTMKSETESKAHKGEFRTLQRKYIHANEGNYKCDICTKLFTRTSLLLRHMKTHTVERNYKCKICNKCYATKYTLLRHVKTHAGERNHKCEICAKFFTTKHSMLEHVKTHATVGTYKCEICGKSFKTKQNMLGHVKTHTGEKN